MKPAPERLLLSAYPFATELETRFGDMDVLGHLNNVSLGSLYEEGRVRFVSSLVEPHSQTDGERAVLAEATFRYLVEGRYPGRVIAAAGLLRVGRTSYVVGQAMFQSGVCIGTADAVVVWTAEGRPSPIPDPLRRALSGVLLDAAARADA